MTGSQYQNLRNDLNALRDTLTEATSRLSEPRADRMLRLPDVLALVKVSRPTLYRMIQRKQFPAPVKLSTNVSAWSNNAIQAWLVARLSVTDQEVLDVEIAHR